MQLSSVKENKLPFSYRHIAPRVDTGLKRSKRARSLTNLSRATSAMSNLRAHPNRIEITEEHNDSLASSLEESNVSLLYQQIY